PARAGLRFALRDQLGAQQRGQMLRNGRARQPRDPREIGARRRLARRHQPGEVAAQVLCMMHLRRRAGLKLKMQPGEHVTSRFIFSTILAALEINASIYKHFERTYSRSSGVGWQLSGEKESLCGRVERS